MSESTDKLALLTECLDNVPDDIKRRIKSINVTWKELGDINDSDWVAVPDIQIELYPQTPPILSAPPPVSPLPSREPAFIVSKS